MIRELKNNEIKNVAGGLVYDEVYPYIPAGYEIVGFSQEVVGYDVVSWTEYQGLFTKVEYVNTTPIYNINPIFAPISTTYIYF